MTQFSNENDSRDADLRDTDSRDAILRDFTQAALPAVAASPALRERVALLAHQADEKRQMAADKRALRLRLAFSGATLAILAAIFGMVWPQWTSNRALAQINAAMAGVSSVEMTTYRLENGKRITRDKTYFQNGQWRVENTEDGYTTLYKGGKRWFYDARAEKVTVQNGVKGAFGWNPSGFTLADMMRDFGAQGEKTSLTPQGQTTLNGRDVKRVLLQTKTNYETMRWLLLVDAKTDLPLRGEMKVLTRYGKAGRWITEMSYNRPLSAKLFEPKFSRTAKFIELGRQDADLKTRLARGLAKKRVGERVVAIRALEVNRNGDVFLFYTAGKRSGPKNGDGFGSDNWFAGRDWKVYLSDSLGTRYSYLRYGTAGFSAADVGGERLEADRWVPSVAPEIGAKWKPRNFFINFEINPKNLHGNFKTTFAADYSARARFGIRRAETEPGTAPPIAAQLMHLSADDIVRDASQERGELPPDVSPSPELVREVEEIGTFSPDSKQIATGIVGSVRMVDAQSGAQRRFLRAPAAFSKLKVGAPLFSADGRVLCAAISLEQSPKSDSQWCVWSLGDGQLLGSWRWKSAPDVLLRSSQVSPDGKTLHLVSSLVTKRGGAGKNDWVESENIRVQERDILTGKVLFEHVLKHDGFVVAVDQKASEAADWLVVTNQLGNSKRGTKGVTRAWNVRSGEIVQTFGNTPNYENVRIVLAKQAPLLAAWGNYFEDKNGTRHVKDAEIRLYDATSGELQRTVTPDTNWITPFALSDDGLHLACESEENRISIWNTQTGRLEQSLTGHGASPYAWAFSPDGKWLQSVDAKEKALLWHLG